MARYAEELDADNLHDPLPMGGKGPEDSDELDVVADAFNGMRERVLEDWHAAQPAR